ncbi:MAG: hypothetical protein L0220_01990 [Acidobacteria bacterium]|nr:hypothetical protein [Acidobacteriota bacterium]
MKHISNSFIIILTVVFLLCGAARGQGRQRAKPKAKAKPASTVTATTKRPVTVTLKNGDPVSGIFLRADADTLQIELKSGRLSMKMSDVYSLVFGAEEETSSATIEEVVKNLDTAESDPNLAAGRKAYNALRKLADAAQIKLQCAQYSYLLVETRSVLEGAFVDITDGSLKTYAELALEAYTDAGKACGAVDGKGVIPINTDPGEYLMDKYKIKPGVNAFGLAVHLKIDDALKIIWAAAAVHLKNLSLSLGQ